jgi:hypothetical protein
MSKLSTCNTPRRTLRPRSPTATILRTRSSRSSLLLDKPEFTRRTVIGPSFPLKDHAPAIDVLEVVLAMGPVVDAGAAARLREVAVLMPAPLLHPSGRGPAEALAREVDPFGAVEGCMWFGAD